jgi:hypothetical protein
MHMIKQRSTWVQWFDATFLGGGLLLAVGCSSKIEPSGTGGETTSSKAAPTMSSGIESTSDGDKTTDHLGLIPPCRGVACRRTLLSSSPGQTVLEVEMQGAFCGVGCGAVTPTLYEVSSGLAVPNANITSCDRCDESPLGDCQGSSVSGRTWRGEIGLADATCEWGSGASTYCQSAPLFVEPGRYRAELCTLPSYLDEATGEARCFDRSITQGVEPICNTVEFDFPSSAPAVIHLNSLPPPAADGGRPSSSPNDAGMSALE